MLNKGGIVAVGDKADVLTVAFAGVEQAERFRQAARFVLCHAAERKVCLGKLSLGEGIEHIALVFCQIGCLFQEISAASAFFYGRVVTCHNDVVVQLFRAANQLFKFDEAVAVHTGIGCCACFVGADKPRDDVFAEAVLEIVNVVGNASGATDRARVLDIIERAASSVAGDFDIVVVKELEGDARTVIARLLGEIGGNGAVNASAHGNQCFLQCSVSQSNHFINAASCCGDGFVAKQDFLARFSFQTVVDVHQ